MLFFLIIALGELFLVQNKIKSIQHAMLILILLENFE
jgi:hypothetical protein